MTTNRIHLLEKRGLMKRVHKDTHEYESGFWAVAPDMAEKLVGGDIYFHKSQTARSYFGGTILSYRVEEDGENAGRVVFRLQAKAEHRNVLPGRDRWSMQKKVILADEDSVEG